MGSGVLFVVVVVAAVVGGVEGSEHKIPQLDLNDWYHGSEEQKQIFAQEWDRAFHQYGFCVLVNHHVASTTPLYEGLKDFYALPQEEKEKYEKKGVEGLYGPGYHHFGKERQKDNGQNLADLNENFQFYPSEDGLSLSDPKEEDSPPGLFKLANTYYQENLHLLSTIFDINDAALSLPKGTFSRLYFEDGYLRALRLANYFELKEEILAEGAARIGAHTDYAGFTLLKADEVPGLEVAVGESHFDSKDLKMEFEEWVPVPYVPNSIIINCGDMIRYFTNGHWRSAYHRVRATKPQRVSLVLFTGPGLDSRTDRRIESCEVCKNEVRRFDDIQMTLDDYLKWRMTLSDYLKDLEEKEEL